MRLGFGQEGSVTARLSFYGLVLLTFGLLVALSGFATYVAPAYNACKSAWDNLLVRASSLGVLVPGVAAGTVVLVVTLTLVRQWRRTQVLLRSLSLYRVPVPDRLARMAADIGLAERVDCVSQVGLAPFCYGFVRPRVVVPLPLLEVLDDSELRAVLEHESYHVYRRDPLKIWISRALARGLYFIPLAWDLRDSYLIAKEIAADDMTAGRDGLALASALVKMLSSADAHASPAVTAARPLELSLAALGQASIAGVIHRGSKKPLNHTEERIRRLIDGRPRPLALPSVRSVVLSIAVIVAIFTVSYANLSAAPFVSVSQECVPVDMRTEPEVMPGPWPGMLPGVNPMPVLPGAHSPGIVPDQSGCDLLVPACPKVDPGDILN